MRQKKTVRAIDATWAGQGGIRLARSVAALVLLPVAACGREPAPAGEREPASRPEQPGASEQPAAPGAPTSQPPPLGAPSSEPTRSPTGTPSSAPPAGSEPSRPSPPASGWTSGIVEVPARVNASQGIPVVSAVRTGRHDGFDRVTIELLGDGMPGYHAEYVGKPLHQCGSGNEVFPVGDGWLEIRLDPAQAHTEQGSPTLPGREIQASGRLLRRIYVTCDFEGMVTLVLALDSPNPYQVSTLSGPRRIVVDVRH